MPPSWTSARSGSPDSDATRDNQLGRQALHHLVSLIARQNSHHGDPSIWPRSRGPDVQDFTFNLQTVTRPDWIWPIKLTASPDNAAGEPHATLDQGRMVIAAVCQPLAAKPDSRVFLAASLSRWKG